MDYLIILKNEFARRTANNPRYSQRAFARDIGLSAPRLTEVLQGKKGLSEKVALSLGRKLGLNQREQALFVASVMSKHSRSKTAKAKATKEFRLLSEQRMHLIRSQDLEMATSWYHLAILELTELPECKHSIMWFAQRLGLKTLVVENAIQRLTDLGWLTYSAGKFKSRFEESESEQDIPSASIKRYHREVLDLAGQVIDREDPSTRDFQSLILAFPFDKMEEAKEEIRSFHRRFADKFHREENAKDSVVQLSIQLFRIDKQNKGVTL